MLELLIASRISLLAFCRSSVSDSSRLSAVTSVSPTARLRNFGSVPTVRASDFERFAIRWAPARENGGTLNDFNKCGQAYRSSGGTYSLRGPRLIGPSPGI